MVGTPDLTDVRNEMDQMIADVMPEDWPGHARIAAFNQSEDLSAQATEYAVSFADRLSEKANASPDVVAEHAVEKAQEKHS